MRQSDYADMGYCVGNGKEVGVAEALFALSGTLNSCNYKGSSTKRGNSPKAIKARRKKNKNKKTHRI